MTAIFKASFDDYLDLIDVYVLMCSLSDEDGLLNTAPVRVYLSLQDAVQDRDNFNNETIPRRGNPHYYIELAKTKDLKYNG